VLLFATKMAKSSLSVLLSAQEVGDCGATVVLLAADLANSSLSVLLVAPQMPH
jgi:hypothetical protein